MNRIVPCRCSPPAKGEKIALRVIRSISCCSALSFVLVSRVYRVALHTVPSALSVTTAVTVHGCHGFMVGVFAEIR